jgi:hypothetical protein
MAAKAEPVAVTWERLSAADSSPGGLSEPEVETEDNGESMEELPSEDDARGIKLESFDLSHPETLRARWCQLVEHLKGMTADMVREPENLELRDGALILATLRDTYTVRECLKLDRKQMIERILSEICQQEVRVDFRPSANAVRKADLATPQLPRAQQLRILLEHEFVRQTMEIFSAEVTNFYQKQPNQHPN